MKQSSLAESAPAGANLPVLAQRGLRHAFDRTPLIYPTAISLHRRNCPQCKEPLAVPELAHGTVRSACRTQGCGFALDLFWVPA